MSQTAQLSNEHENVLHLISQKDKEIALLHEEVKKMYLKNYAAIPIEERSKEVKKLHTAILKSFKRTGERIGNHLDIYTDLMELKEHIAKMNSL
jgi:hypothetical protein